MVWQDGGAPPIRGTSETQSGRSNAQTLLSEKVLRPVSAGDRISGLRYDARECGAGSSSNARARPRLWGIPAGYHDGVPKRDTGAGVSELELAAAFRFLGFLIRCTLMNAVPVDEADIQARLDGVAGEFIPHDAPPGEEPKPEAPNFEMASACVVVILDKVIVPNWELTDAEKDLLHKQFINVAQTYAPSLVNLNPRAIAMFGLVGSLFAIAIGRIDEYGLRPMRKPKPSDDATSTSTHNANIDGDSVATGAGFRTAA